VDFLGNPDPASIDRVAGELTKAQGELSRVHGDLSSGVSRLVGGSWHGDAAATFQGHWGTEGSSIAALSGAAGRMAGILRPLASELRNAMAIARQAESLAAAHGLTIGADGSVTGPTSGGRFGTGPNPAQVQALVQVQGLVNQAKSVANAARSSAAGALAGVSVPQVQPGVSAKAAAAWAQASAPGRPNFPPTLGQDIWNSLRGNVLPPSTLGALGQGLWAGGRALMVFGKIASWMTIVQLGRFAPRDALGRFVSPASLSWWETIMKSGDGKNWIALPYMANARNFWKMAGKWGGRAGTTLAVVTSGLNQWFQDAGNPRLDTASKVGRATYRGVAVGAATWVLATQGAELGMGIGSFAGPVGTVVGGVIGGVVGGVVGSGVANFVVDHTVNWVGHATDTAVHTVESGGKAFVHDVGDAGSKAIHFLASLNPF
jgi:uncharacterized protein YukE